jgi:glycerophosphoryl diester phosphodiesterase
MDFWTHFKDKEHLLIAHRGARAFRAENTLSAFEKAVGKCDAIEFDVGFSKDGVALILHDDTLERTSDVQNHPEFFEPFRLVDYTYEELLKLDFSSWFLQTDPFLSIKNGLVSSLELEKLPIQRILKLEELLVFLRQNDMYANLEIKDLSGTKFETTGVEEILKILKKTNTQERILISSFNHKHLQEAYKLSPNIPLAALVENEHPQDLIEYLTSLHVKAYNPDFEITDEALIKELKRAGFFVNVFTVNEKSDIKKLFNWGAKSVFSDYV